jgi:hypothetical protein
LSKAPLHLMRLEFRLDESAFKTFMKDVEIELGNEQQALNKHEDIGKIINRHNVNNHTIIATNDITFYFQNRTSLQGKTLKGKRKQGSSP